MVLLKFTGHPIIPIASSEAESMASDEALEVQRSSRERFRRRLLHCMVLSLTGRAGLETLEIAKLPMRILDA
jgi:hypothetical protein